MIANLSYDVNAAIRFGLEGAYFNTRYANQGTLANYNGKSYYTLERDGDYYTIRVGAWYFF